ncbi:MAG: PBSX family phage terminase large subunit [Peptostreptococcaceae bacterium]|nr:PBSX family phage terminase large subunit [Peptostreptococcaceae bacterium]
MQITKEINPKFENFLFHWDSKYQFLTGGYGSSKSYHVALKLILKLYEEKRTCLVVREVYETIRESCFSLFLEILDDMDLLADGKRSRSKVVAITSPMQLKFPNGSKVIFKGMDKPKKLKSIHNISIIWIEECSEVKYEGFKELIGRMRHPSLPLYMILSSNPVEKANWTYKHFFMDELAAPKRIILDDETLYEQGEIKLDNTYYHHSTADDNLFLPKSYLEELEEMKNYDQDLYRIARKGRYGVNGILVLPQFEVMEHQEVLNHIGDIPKRFYRVGMDFGFEESFNAVLRMAIDDKEKVLYIYWEYYKNKMTDDKTAKELEEFRRSKERIRADSAEPKAIAFYQQEGFKMIGAKKFAGSRLANTKKMKRFRKIICSDQCENAIRELKTLTYAKDKDEQLIYDEFNIDSHCMSAMWYGLDGYEVADIKKKINHSGKGAR